LTAPVVLSAPDLRGKTAIVTGAAGGIGSRIAEALREQGARVVACDRKAAEDAVVACDVTDEASVRAMVEAAAADGRGLDVVVNCAAVRGPLRRADELAREDWDAILATGLTGSWLISKHAAPHLAASGAGAIVNVGSTAGRLPRVGQIAYCVAKAGVEQLTRVMALELAASGVRVNAVCPGATDTPFLAAAAETEGQTPEEFAAAVAAGDPASFRAGIPLGRIAAADDHAQAVVFLASHAARHITGQVLYVDGGETIL
jgi:2,3-dihydro-2,3-dihydroxybenzoate dehydrogenase